MNSTSNLYREESMETLRAIAAAHFPDAALQEALLLSGGLFNTTYRLTLSDGQRLVLRLGPVNRHLLMGFEHGMMAAEAHVYSLCEAAGIPVSHVRAVDCRRAIVDRDYMLVDCIDASPFSECELTDEDANRLKSDTGAYTRRLHGITGERFGRVSEMLRGVSFAAWRDALRHELTAWEAVAVPHELYTADEIGQIEAAFARCAPLLDEITTPRLVHADLWAGNVLVAGCGKNSKVAAIIDCDRALFGDPEFEFAISWIGSAPALKGYGMPLNPHPHAVLRRMLYNMLTLLLDSYVYVIQYNNEEMYIQARKDALNLAHGILQH